MAGKTFGGATITAATNVTPPSSLVGTDPPTPVAVNAPFCRIQGSIMPSSDSDIGFEVWAPPEGAWNGKYEGIGNGGFAGSLNQLSVVNNAALKACHGENGVVDDPGQCRFDPSTLLCKAGESKECQSAAQITALKKIYSGMQDASGKSIFPGYPPGGEAGPAWTLWLTGGEPKRVEGTLIYGFSTGYFANMVFDKADWSFHGQNPADALAQTQEKTAQAVDAANPDLGAFRDAGGKLIQYHGWNDAAIPAPSSIDYYEEVAAKPGGIEKIQSFYRLFMAPGMQHCGLGLGPNAVGGVFGLPSPNRDPAHDVVAELAHWVEDGAAPDQIIATLYRDNDPSKGIAAQRPWCAHPAVARFSGQGARTDAASYDCSAPAK
jgi:hypothetical protein